MSNPTTGPQSFKMYQCTSCQYELEEKTNHWGQIYQHCPVCRHLTAWNCMVDIPEGYDKAPDWKLVELNKIFKER